MKKLLIGLALLGGVTAITYASLGSRKQDNKKQATEKKAEKKKECRKSCLFS